MCSPAAPWQLSQLTVAWADAVVASVVASWHSAQAAAGWLLTGRSAHQRGLSSWVRPITSTDREAVTVRMNRPTVASSATTRAALIRIDTAPPGRHLPAAPSRIRRVPIKSTDMAHAAVEAYGGIEDGPYPQWDAHSIARLNPDRRQTALQAVRHPP